MNDDFFRVDKQNPLDSNNGVRFRYQNIHKKPTPLQCQQFHIQKVNLFNSQQTGLPQFSLPELHCITLGKYRNKTRY